VDPDAEWQGENEARKRKSGSEGDSRGEPSSTQLIGRGQP